MVPRSFEAPLRSHDPSVITTFYSKDNGESWSLGEMLGSNAEIICPNETVAALTSGGEVYLNIRFKGYCRARAYSKNGYSDWRGYQPDYALPDPQCFGSVAAYNDGKHPYTLIFANCATKESRSHVTVRASFDDGVSYPVSKLIDRERGGYVEVAVDNSAGVIYLLYEDKFGVSDHLVRFDYEWLCESK
jgi:sialidase-1